MDRQVEIALMMLEDTLTTGDEAAIRQQVKEMRETGIFCREIYKHLDSLDTPAEQLRAMIKAIRIEELSKQGISKKEIAVARYISKLPHNEQMNLLREAVRTDAEPEKKKVIKNNKVIKPSNKLLKDIFKNLIFFGVIIAIGYFVINIGR